MDQLFKHEMEALLTQSIEILDNRYGLDKNMGNKNKTTEYLTRYSKIYKNTDPEEHHIYFEKLYKKYKNVIPETLNNDSWLVEGGIEIKFGEYNKLLKDKCENIKIMISKIYNCAVELQNSALKNTQGLSGEIVSKNKDLIRPSILLLHLMRIFYSVVSETDKQSLIKIIDTLEKELNVSNKIITSTPNLLEQCGFGPHLLQNGGEKSSIAGVFNMITSFCKASGIDVPEDMTPPTDGQLVEALNGVMQNDLAKNLFETVSSSLKSNDKSDNAMKSMIQKIFTPENVEGFKDTLIKTAEIAQENSNK
jgi:hypothetical protein